MSSRHAAHKIRTVDSLLDVVEDGNEYGSIVDCVPRPDLNLLEEVARGLRAIEGVRKRPCLAYIGNVVPREAGPSGIDSSDDLPFTEMVSGIPASERKIDIVLATLGGSAQQVSRFVNCLRQGGRFDEIDFLLPSFCMSAGTLFALSGDHIWMTARACLGPIDPQVPTTDGRYVPAQALLLLVNELQKSGEAAMKNGLPVPWTAVRIIDTIDKKELGDAITASHYSTMMASQFLKNYKFRHWIVRESSGVLVTPEYREERAMQIAADLASHDRWKSHGHALSREVLWKEIKLLIDHPDDKLERAINRLWAVCHFLFDKTTALKIIVSSGYKYLKHSIRIRSQQ